KRIRLEGDLAGIAARMPADECHARGALAMQYRDARVGSRCDAGGDPRNDFPGDARRHQCLGLLAAAAKDEGVASLEPRHHAAAARGLDQQAVDLCLRQRMAAGALSHAADLNAGPSVREDLGVDEMIDEDQIALAQGANRAQRKQIRISRAGADEIDLARPGHERLERRSARARSMLPILGFSGTTCGGAPSSSSARAQVGPTAATSVSARSASRSASSRPISAATWKRWRAWIWLVKATAANRRSASPAT